MNPDKPKQTCADTLCEVCGVKRAKVGVYYLNHREITELLAWSLSMKDRLSQLRAELHGETETPIVPSSQL